MKIEELKKYEYLEIKASKSKNVFTNLKIGNYKISVHSCLYWMKAIKNYHGFNSGFLILAERDYETLKRKNILKDDIIHIVSKKNPRFSFVKILRDHFDEKLDVVNCVDEHIMHNKNIIIMNNVFIGNNVTIGDGTIIYPNVVIHHGVKIGKNCIIRESTSLGTHGMGFEKDGDEWIRFPQIGGLIIGDSVEIGSHSDIKRAALDDTIIGNGSKLGSYINIGHNCVIGNNCMFTARCIVAGSSNIGDNFYMGINSSVKNGIIIGKNVTLGAHSFVRSNIPDNKTYIGSPAAELIKKNN